VNDTCRSERKSTDALKYLKQYQYLNNIPQVMETLIAKVALRQASLLFFDHEIILGKFALLCKKAEQTYQELFHGRG